MGLDVANGLFGNFHLNWAGTRWFSDWCRQYAMPDPFIGWASGCNNGDQCDLDRDPKAVQRAKDWCNALELRCPEIVQLGKSLLENPPEDLHAYLYPHKDGETPNEGQLSEDEWSRRAVAAWYAILRHGGTLEYW